MRGIAVAVKSLISWLYFVICIQAVACVSGSSSPEKENKEAAALSTKAPDLGEAVVVLDPGHGGTDEGATGISGVREKDLTLAIAKEAAAALRTLPGVTVHLTREEDRDLSLPERTDLARRWGATALLSIHLNSNSDPALHGMETYWLDTASDEAAARLAAVENRSGGGVEGMEVQVGEATRIARSLEMEGRALVSRRLAVAIHSTLFPELQEFYGKEAVLDRGVKTALFYVLVGSEMPAVLLEVGYLTHPQEEQRVRTRAFQEQIGRGVAEGVQKWLAEMETEGGEESPPRAMKPEAAGPTREKLPSPTAPK